MKKIDLHIHTNFSSDADYSPMQVVDLALKRKLKIIAITDHNNVNGIEQAINYSKNKKIKIVPGVEISCADYLGLKEVHILGLFIDYKNESFHKFLNKPEKSMKEVINTVKQCKGIPVLAHPGLYLKDAGKIIEDFIRQGGEGIEVFYPYEKAYGFSKSRAKFLRKRFFEIAKRENLFISGGSDFHGSKREVKLGDSGLRKKDFKKIKC